MAKGQQRSNKEKKKPKQDKKKLAPAPSPLASISAQARPGAARRNSFAEALMWRYRASPWRYLMRMTLPAFVSSLRCQQHPIDRLHFVHYQVLGLRRLEIRRIDVTISIRRPNGAGTKMPVATRR